MDARPETEQTHCAADLARRKREIVCMICGKGGFRTLTCHLGASHQRKPCACRKHFGITGGQALSARSYSESRRQTALERGSATTLPRRERSGRRTSRRERKPLTPKPGLRPMVKRKRIPRRIKVLIPKRVGPPASALSSDTINSTNQLIN
jgi:hypothetical protein